MSAKHKRPFFVFAAVAAVCCMVLVTGIRGSKADDGRIPVVAEGSSVSDAGPPISPIPDAPDSSSSNPDHSGPAGADPSGDGGFEITTPGFDESLTDPDGGDAESGSGSGVMAPPTGVDSGGVTVPPVADEADGKGRGDRGGKKNKGKDKDEEDDESAAEVEEEVDPDVYELPDDVDEDHEDEGDHPEGPDDPETTP